MKLLQISNIELYAFLKKLVSQEIENVLLYDWDTVDDFLEVEFPDYLEDNNESVIRAKCFSMLPKFVKQLQEFLKTLWTPWIINVKVGLPPSKKAW